VENSGGLSGEVLKLYTTQNKWYNAIMTTYYEQKMKHLVAMRSSLITILIVLIGGLFTMHLLNLFPLIYWTALIFGIYFIIVFIGNLINVNNDISELLKEIKND